MISLHDLPIELLVEIFLHVRDARYAGEPFSPPGYTEKSSRDEMERILSERRRISSICKRFNAIVRGTHLFWNHVLIGGCHAEIVKRSVITSIESATAAGSIPLEVIWDIKAPTISIPSRYNPTGSLTLTAYMIPLQQLLSKTPPRLWRSLTISTDSVIPRQLLSPGFSDLESLNINGSFALRANDFLDVIEQTATGLKTLALSVELPVLQNRLSKTMKRISTLYINTIGGTGISDLPPNIQTLSILHLPRTPIFSTHLTSLSTTYPFYDSIDMPNLRTLSIIVQTEPFMRHIPVLFPRLRELKICNYSVGAMKNIVAPELRTLNLNHLLESRRGVELIAETLSQSRRYIPEIPNSPFGFGIGYEGSLIYPKLTSLITDIRLQTHPNTRLEAQYISLVANGRPIDDFIKEWAQGIIYHRLFNFPDIQGEGLSQVKCTISGHPYPIYVHLDSELLYRIDIAKQVRSKKDESRVLEEMLQKGVLFYMTCLIISVVSVSHLPEVSGIDLILVIVLILLVHYVIVTNEYVGKSRRPKKA